MCHQSSTEEFFGADGQAKLLTLLHWVMQSLLQVFTHDRQRFVKQETFDLLMQPLVDQVFNLYKLLRSYQKRVVWSYCSSKIYNVTNFFIVLIVIL